MPWTNDKLNREEYGNMLDLIIENQHTFRKVSDKSLVIAINSGYGSGKTTFLDMWSKHLKLKSNSMKDSLIIDLNVWLSDDYENALIPFIHCIHQSLKNIENPIIKKKSMTKLLVASKKHH